MIAKLENEMINVYNEKNKLIGGIKTHLNFKNANFVIGEKNYQLKRDKWNAKILENDTVKYSLKVNSFTGSSKILENKRKITGVFGLKWGTKMMDDEKNTLIKIRNENQFIDKKKYEIEISNKEVTDLEILTTLYAHLYGSNMKAQAVIIGVITGAGAIIFLT